MQPPNARRGVFRSASGAKPLHVGAVVDTAKASGPWIRGEGGDGELPVTVRPAMGVWRPRRLVDYPFSVAPVTPPPLRMLIIRRSLFESERSLSQREVAGIGLDGLHHILGITRFGSRSLEFDGEAQG